MPRRTPLLVLASLGLVCLAPALAGDDQPSEAAPKWNVENPPGERERVVIETTETTWSEVDVSPDGRTIVFDMLGDLFTLPIEGGEAKALTSGLAWDFQPRFSPDGREIAFVSDRGGGDNVWIIDAAGTNPRPVSEEKAHLVHNPAWSPDGTYIVAKKGFTSTRSIPAGEIWLFHVGGGGGLQLTERPHGKRDQKTMAEPAFSPDGRFVYFSQDMTPGMQWQYNKDSTGAIFAIRRLELESGRIDTLVSGPGGAIRPVPSPDGKKLAFVKRVPGLKSALYVKDLESGIEKAVYVGLDRDLQETNGSQGNAPHFAWLPEGDEIVFWAGGKIRRVDVESGASRVIPMTVKAEHEIQPALRFPVEVAARDFDVKVLRWAQRSPDGRSALYQALGKLWLHDMESGERRRLTRAEGRFEFYPSFSRDGREVVFVTWDDQELGSVRVVTLETREERVLTPRPGHYLSPAFSPDGDTVAYRKITGGYLLAPQWSQEPGLYVVPTSGGAPRLVTRAGFQPHFGSSGDRLFFSATENQTERVLKSIALDGTKERTHLRGGDITEYSVSPDGRWVAFAEQFNAYVAPFTLTGREVKIGSKSTSVPVRRVAGRSGEFLRWSPDAASLTWSHGPVLYERALDDAFAFLAGNEKELPEPATQGVDLSFRHPFDTHDEVLALVGARLVTMRGAREGKQEVIEKGTLVVKGPRIVALGSTESTEIPEGARVIDVSGKTIIPGMVDAHAHGAMARSEITPEQNWMQFSNLAFGVTTIHDPSNDTSSIFAAAEMQKAGLVVGPRVFSTGTIIYGAEATGYFSRIEGYEDALFHVQRLKDMGAISVKSYQQPRRDQRQQVIAAARELGIMVVPEGGAKFQHNMTEIVDGHTGIEHAIPLARAYDDVRQLWSATETGYTPTFGVAYGGISGENYWYDRTEVWRNERLMRYAPRSIIEPRSIRRPTAPDGHYNHFEVGRFAKELRDLGVSVQIGAHGQREGLAAHWEVWMMHQGGFTPWEALRGATIDGAWYLGLDGHVGSLEVGKLADLAVIDGNPLDDIRRSEFVTHTMIHGRLYETATMNQVAPESVERQPFFFETEGGDTLPAPTAAWIEAFAEQHGWVH